MDLGMAPTKVQNIVKDRQSRNFIALINYDIKDYDKKVIELVKFMTSKKHIPGVYITLNKPYGMLFEKFSHEKINTDLIIFIDAISNMTTKKQKDLPHAIFLETPQDLSDVSIALNEVIESIHSKRKFLIIDSINTFLLYNDEDLVAKFFHFLISKIRSWNIHAFILNVKGSKHKNIVNEVGQFCDLVVDV